MVNVVHASSLTLGEVQQQFQLDERLETDLSQFLELQPLTEAQTARMTGIQQNWKRYYRNGKVTEGAVKILSVSPLLTEAGYLANPELRLSLEEQVNEIEIEDGDRVIRGRMDMLVCRDLGDRAPLCVLVIEAKNSAVNAMEGLPQLLVYMQSFLEHQEFVWGLVTNGSDYVFVRLERELFRLFRGLSLLFPEDGQHLLQALMALGAA
ncbi:MAG: restriction endonuclease subunit R [Geitlerinemataceae cyanobacterium]